MISSSGSGRGRNSRGGGNQDETENRRVASGGDEVGSCAAGSTGTPGAADIPVPMPNYAFFAKYTYSNECALLAYNFHEIMNKQGVFECFSYKHDHRLVSVTLAYVFYKYQIHHCDMALDLAMTLCYLEDLKASKRLDFENNDALNVICYFAFLAHVFNADRTIRLQDWYKEIGWRTFRSCRDLNTFVFFLFSNIRKFRLKVPEARVKRYIQKLCNVPTQIRDAPPPSVHRNAA